MYVNDIFDSIKKEFDKKRNSHSYIFYTNDFFSCLKDVYNLINYIFIGNEKNISKIYEMDFFDLKYSDNKNIVKEDINKLKTFFQNTTYLNKKRIYLIEEAHKLNSSSANMILKFLEEPSDNIVGFFITDNLDGVLPTIKSRCQIINVFYKENVIESVNEDIYLIKDLFLKNKFKNLILSKKFFEKYDRNKLINLLNDALLYYINDIENSQNIDIIKKINYAITLLKNNVLVDYVFDYLILGGDIDEYSIS